MSSADGIDPGSAPAGDPDGPPAGAVVVRYWAAARTAAGVKTDVVTVPGQVSLQWVLDDVLTRHPAPRFREVLRACSVLVGDRPVGGYDATEVTVHPGDSVELLPPFAGG